MFLPRNTLWLLEEQKGHLFNDMVIVLIENSYLDILIIAISDVEQHCSGYIVLFTYYLSLD